MSLSNAVIDAMLAAGCTAEQLAAAMKAANAENEARAERKRANNAERQRRFKARQRAADDGQDNAGNALPGVTGVTSVTEGSLSLSPNENNSNPHTHTLPENTPAREEPIFHVEAWRAHLAADAAAKPARAKQPHRLPDGWEPVLTEAAQRKVDGWPPGMLEDQLAAFRDHAADKGRTSKDWQAAFRTWITNADRWKPKYDRPSQRQAPAQHDDSPRNPYVRAVIARQSARSAAERGEPRGWAEDGADAFSLR